MSQYYAVLTNHGQQKMEEAIASGNLAIIQRFVAGDGVYGPPNDEPVGTYTDGEGNEQPVYGPSRNQTELRSTKQTGDVESIQIRETGDENNPTQVSIRVKLDSNQGGYTASELGLLENDQAPLFAVAKIAPKTLVEAENGESAAAYVIIHIEVGNAQNVQIVAGPETGATQQDIDNSIAKYDQQIAQPRGLTPYTAEEAMQPGYLRSANGGLFRFLGDADTTGSEPTHNGSTSTNEDWELVFLPIVPEAENGTLTVDGNRYLIEHPSGAIEAGGRVVGRNVVVRPIKPFPNGVLSMTATANTDGDAEVEATITDQGNGTFLVDNLGSHHASYRITGY